MSHVFEDPLQKKLEEDVSRLMSKLGNESKVERFFDFVEESMRLRFLKLEANLTHPGEKGSMRERRVADFLSSILPKKYGIGTGHIISTQEPFISHQTDIVIYDAQNGIALPYDNYYSIFPCEWVYATIEVKSKLTASDGDKREKTSIYQCIERTDRLKKLKGSNLPQIHSIVFAYEADWTTNATNKVKHWFETLGNNYALRLPEMVFVLNPNSFVLSAAGQNRYNEDGKLPLLYPEISLLHFVTELLQRLSETEEKTLKAGVPTIYLEEYKKWYPGDLMSKVWDDHKHEWVDICSVQGEEIQIPGRE
jgi:hypothetical protein